MAHTCNLHCKHLPAEDHAAMLIQEELDDEFITEIKQELGLYLVNQKPVYVDQRRAPPKRKRMSMEVEVAFLRINSRLNAAIA